MYESHGTLRICGELGEWTRIADHLHSGRVIDCNVLGLCSRSICVSVTTEESAFDETAFEMSIMHEKKPYEKGLRSRRNCIILTELGKHVDHGIKCAEEYGNYVEKQGMSTYYATTFSKLTIKLYFIFNFPSCNVL